MHHSTRFQAQYRPYTSTFYNLFTKYKQTSLKKSQIYYITVVKTDSVLTDTNTQLHVTKNQNMYTVKYIL